MLHQATAPEDDSGPVPKALLVFAHPDDETIALGARIGRLRNALLVHVTDGAPANGLDQQAHGFETLASYRAARRQELDSMLRVAGAGGLRRECLDIPDQEASLELTEITRRVIETVQGFKPQVVFTHPYEGGHPDHDACAFAVHIAIGLIQCRGEREPLMQDPTIIESPFYHGGPSGFEAGTFLPAEDDLPEIVYKLSSSEAQRKEARLSCFTSQRETLSPFRLEEERFRIAPAYDFSRAPHAGTVFYDERPWGMNSQGFVQLASEAQTALAEEMKPTCN